MIIALDGPAGVGKSTIARELASKTGFYYLNSGNFYRALTFEAGSRDIESKKEVIEMAMAATIEIIDERFCINGRDVHDQLHSDAVDERVAVISAIPEVRDIVNTMLRNMAMGRNIIMEGRDITTVVFPDAEMKVYLDASIETRALRRYNQGVSSLSLDEIMEGIKKRDTIDKNKTVGALKKAKDAIYLDTSDLTIDQVCEKVLAKIDTKNQGSGR